MPRGLVRLGVGTVAAGLLLATVAAPPATAGPNRPGGKLVPAAGALFGTTVDGKEPGPGTGLVALERRIGRKFDIVNTYYDWQNKFPTVTERNLAAGGRIPMISWKGVALHPIISGRFDHMIRARADALRALKTSVFLRWGWEMNGSWERWGGANNMPNGPAKFVRAWRHIRNIFRAAHATNVVFVWSPNDGDLPRESWNHFTRYYPGDKYVDWVGVDGFNWGTTHVWSNWLSIDGIIKPVYSVYHRRKPIMLAETGSTEKGGSKSKWIAHMRSVLRTRYPAVAAMLYFNGTSPDNADFRATTSRAAFRAYRAMAGDPYWNPAHTDTSS
jgi:hypothetical protein